MLECFVYFVNGTGPPQFFVATSDHVFLSLIQPLSLSVTTPEVVTSSLERVPEVLVSKAGA